MKDWLHAFLNPKGLSWPPDWMAPWLSEPWLGDKNIYSHIQCTCSKNCKLEILDNNLETVYYNTLNYHESNNTYEITNKQGLICIKEKYTIHQSLDCGNPVILLYNAPWTHMITPHYKAPSTKWQRHLPARFRVVRHCFLVCFLCCVPGFAFTFTVHSDLACFHMVMTLYRASIMCRCSLMASALLYSNTHSCTTNDTI